jgi:hypothetical protein
VLADGQTALFTAVDVLVEIGSMESDAFPRRVPVLEKVHVVADFLLVHLFHKPHQLLLCAAAMLWRGDLPGAAFRGGEWRLAGIRWLRIGAFAIPLPVHVLSHVFCRFVFLNALPADPTNGRAGGINPF